ncbi:MAG: hypothetical protein QOE34_2064 [Verrucomicrobiota bacterium]|jgi:hypothetical protein
MSLTWAEFLEPYQAGDPPLLSGAFSNRWGGASWEPNEGDRNAAAKLHTQLASRITTQRLGYLDGVEKTALDSVYSLFEKTRKIGDEYPAARHFDAIAWDVLNTRVRPFTAKWHRASESGALGALDATDEFRAELSALQMVLERFDRLLIHLRDGRPVADQPSADESERDETIRDEMGCELPWGIPHLLGGIDVECADKINSAERAAIRARRRHYGIDKDKPHAVALALSGGGIRSATFSLGVLVALAGRGVLPQFDYLSTVSGGGYLGSFLSAYLTSHAKPGKPNDPSIGLRPDEFPFRREEGEAEALRHLRHHSKFLATGSLWSRVKMMSAQIYGMILNSAGVVWIAMLAVLLERFVREWSLLDGRLKPVTYGAVALWAVGALLALLTLRFGRSWQKYADTLVTAPTVLVLALLAWRGLDSIHPWFHPPGSKSPDGSWLWKKETWIAVMGAIPLITSALTGVFGRFLKRAGVVLVIFSGIAGPLFFFGIYLFLYEWSRTSFIGFGIGPIGLTTQWVIVMIAAAVYFLLLDINFTSPHRHYRNKLAEAYLIRPAKKRVTGKPFDNAVSVRLSELGELAPRSPYHLINSALNVPGSTNPQMQGRLTDFFLFSPRYCGSPLTGYRATSEWEKADRHLDLGTAMAISAAAAGPQMGIGTLKKLSFWLALMNVRLGYWLRKPGKHALLFGGAPGLWFLLKEMLGTMNEKSAWLNVSDGGHIENLGVYELLRRRCKYIVVIDGEQDSKMTFKALTTLQRLAFIDLGVHLDLDLDDLRLNALGLSRSHFRFCRIRYPKEGRGSEEVHGYLLYLKLSLTGNEGEFIRRYRLDEPVFPHHSTADQFFSETQFEAYRSLGEHIGDKLFLRALLGDQLSESKSINVEEWFRELGQNLLEPLPARTASSVKQELL